MILLLLPLLLLPPTFTQAALTTTPPSTRSPRSTLNFGKIKRLPSSSYPMPSQSSSSFSLEISPHQPIIFKKPPRLNEATKQALKDSSAGKCGVEDKDLQKEKEREAFGMFKLIPTMPAMKGTPRENKRKLILLKETRSISDGGRRMTDENEVSGVNVSLPPLLNPSTGSSSGSCSVSVPLNSHQGIMQQWFMQSQGIQ
ncbi:uncharacterized protein MONOS_12895 [Monocercomonoides exilis]|uniref:uncharacterized protein n=1 Tax=Monocercomonoides exilis TaxID=2049356 RepID=UPI00355A9125|nr:hypothetical protein MONOS_12895 [Monocercomonoides exilis]|eukprot:MONOS_12895.1-p1 / transcript=MONOS_12895.1 / gene=MONOS_12895 / organism=Monocercomonoides_exilis_PA203 / gene_product=unspecified product / transcript_product=unspecified product / location=Mono_scaffold00747:27966-28760(+) / protein_length=199 / sequence_SO=supercontig / SO=protein_coding / is_pseudo=false